MTAVLLHAFSTFAPGGPEVRAAEIINASGEHFRHLICSIDGRMSAASRLSEVANVRLLGVLGRGRRRHPWPTLRGRLLAGIRLGIEIIAAVRLLRRYKPSLTLCYGLGSWSVGCAARLLKEPYLWLEDGFEASEAEARPLRRTWLRRWAASGARAVLVPSKTLGAVCIRELKLPEHHVIVIPNGVRLDHYRPRDPGVWRQAAGIPWHARVVGTVSHLRQEKRLDLLLCAGTKLDANVYLVIVGGGPCDAKLKAQAKHLGLEERVRFIGHQEDVRPVLQALDLFVCCSDTEQMPISMLEAMASGKPVVTTNVGDCADIIGQEGFPFVIERGKCGRLAQAISEVFRRGDLDAIGGANRARCQRLFSAETTIASHLHIYSQFAGKKNLKALSL